MFLTDILAFLLLEFYERLPILLISRNIEMIELSGKISAIRGMRRVGRFIC